MAGSKLLPLFCVILLVVLQPCYCYYYIAKDCDPSLPQSSQKCVVDGTRKSFQRCFLVKPASQHLYNNCFIELKSLIHYRSFSVCPKSYKCVKTDLEQSLELSTAGNSAEKGLLVPPSSESTENLEEVNIVEDLGSTKPQDDFGSSLPLSGENTDEYYYDTYDTTTSYSINSYESTYYNGHILDLETSTTISGKDQLEVNLDSSTLLDLTTNDYQIVTQTSTSVFATTSKYEYETSTSIHINTSNGKGASKTTTSKSFPILIACFSTLFLCVCLVVGGLKLKKYFWPRKITNSFELTERPNKEN